MVGTFEIVSAPFYQLFTINVFVQKGSDIKQVPALIAVMSSKRTVDYTRLFQVVIDLLQGQGNVCRAMMDYEAAIWKALREVFPLVEGQGCAFHFTQALYRKAKELHLSRAYDVDEGTRLLLQQFMCLCLLPHNNIDGQFERLRTRCTTEKLDQFQRYVGDTWVYANKVPFEPRHWSVHNMTTRTNNDLEGWHNRLKSQGRPHLTLYDLIRAMHEESQHVDWCLAQVRSGGVSRRQNADFV